MLLKPKEIVMYRPAVYGGLGVLNVKYKAMACLIKTFLETAGHDKFRASLYHTILFRYHVLEDLTLANPGIPPFYSHDFFALIRRVHLNSSLNIFKMSEKDWYTQLVEDFCTTEVGVNGEVEYIKCRVERASPTTDWEKYWRLASFIFKIIHQILPT